METKTKLCSRCGRYRELNHFSPDKRAKDGLYPQCKDCWQQYLVILKKKKNSQLMNTYGITLAQYNKLLAEQSFRCKLVFCGAKHSKDSPLVVDHCHKTSRVRGLLCQSCNVGLGFFKDNHELLIAAAHYLVDKNIALEPQVIDRRATVAATNTALEIVPFVRGLLEEEPRDTGSLYMALEEQGISCNTIWPVLRSLGATRNPATGAWFLPTSPGLTKLRKRGTMLTVEKLQDLPDEVA